VTLPNVSEARSRLATLVRCALAGRGVPVRALPADSRVWISDGIAQHQRRCLLLCFSQATSHSECGPCTGIGIHHNLLRFGLLHSHRRSLSGTNLPRGGRQLRKFSAPGPPLARGRSSPPEDRLPHSRPDRRRCRLGGLFRSGMSQSLSRNRTETWLYDL